MNRPIEDRPRERLAERGVEALSDAELLALVLRTGSAGACALDRAGAVLARVGGLGGLERVGTGELVALRGLGFASAAAIVAAVELGRRTCERRKPNGAVFRTSAEVYEHFRLRLAPLRKEVFFALLLDARHRKLREVRVSEGSLTASIVHPREVFAPVVRESAAAVILVHNHPSGDPRPSPEDVDVTRRLRQAGDLLGVRVLDHVIVGADAHHSFADSGW